MKDTISHNFTEQCKSYLKKYITAFDTIILYFKLIKHPYKLMLVLYIPLIFNTNVLKIYLSIYHIHNLSSIYDTKFKTIFEDIYFSIEAWSSLLLF